MVFNRSDFVLPPIGEPAREERQLTDIISTLLESVAFHIYDENKVNQIKFTMQQDLSRKYGIMLQADILWNPPTVTVNLDF